MALIASPARFNQTVGSAVRWYAGGIFGWAMILLVVASVLGYESFVITSDSMQPKLQPGDIVLADPRQRAPAVTEVVVYERGGERYTHRVVAIDGDGSYTTRGDANRREDSDPLTDDEILGKAVAVLPVLGRPLLLHPGVIGAALVVLFAVSSRVRGSDVRSIPVLAILAIGSLLVVASSRAALAGITDNPGSSALVDTVSAVPSTTATAGCGVIVLGPYVDVTWGASSEPDADGYAIERATGSGSFSTLATVGAGTVSYRDSSVAGLSEYSYRVRTLDGTWRSDPGPTATDSTGLCL